MDKKPDRSAYTPTPPRRPPKHDSICFLCYLTMITATPLIIIISIILQKKKTFFFFLFLTE